jgi:putative SOS response-associated peptidase YedK
MCGRFAFYSPRQAVRELYGVEFPEEFEPRYNIAPTQDVAALRIGATGEPEAATLRWGLVPYWAHDPAVGNRLINARAETLAGKPAFRDAFRFRRCVILANGFYEWRKSGQGNTPFYVATGDERPIAFAGLWERWKKGGRRLETCTIVTTDANRLLGDLHDRMPVILSPQSVNQWLASDTPPSALGALLRPAPEELLTCREVGRAVNNPANEGPDLIATKPDSEPT